MFCYILLGVTMHSTDEQIKSSYKKMISRYSPDRHPVHFKKIRSAYENIKTRQDRIKYDILHTDELSPSDLLWLLLLSKPEININQKLFTNYFKEYIDENRTSD